MLEGFGHIFGRALVAAHLLWFAVMKPVSLSHNVRGMHKSKIPPTNTRWPPHARCAVLSEASSSICAVQHGIDLLILYHTFIRDSIIHHGQWVSTVNTQTISHAVGPSSFVLLLTCVSA
ncbi:hypothetical protein BC629DRAFT_1464061 [Irpex lacteus]|nr:hypothetical protein BC629DRAFT_1464061 [Irpex lacteus]